MQRLSVLAALLFARALTAQTRPQVIQGRVSASTGVPVPAPNVMVTVAPTAEILSTRTDSLGAYRVVIVRATGEYVLNVNLIGWRPCRQRVNIAPPDSVATVNVKLAQIPQQLAAVQVRSQRPRPPRGGAGETGPPQVDGTNKQVDG